MSKVEIKIIPERSALFPSSAFRAFSLAQACSSRHALATNLIAEQLARQREGSRDPLTSLLNAKYFHQKLEQRMRKAQEGGNSFTVFLFDLIHFSEVDDRGQMVGDIALAKIAKILAGVVRPIDLARVGGDELAGMTSTPQAAFMMLTRMAEALSGFRWNNIREDDIPPYLRSGSEEQTLELVRGLSWRPSFRCGIYSLGPGEEQISAGEVFSRASLDELCQRDWWPGNCDS